ncbi:hypothetical protein K438DRAFT_1759406 [Mycena galopus ATCC 62051]|nr:hypothetical protein K438DRAFT_1759406 [Mycena galopus ATCC 62051]
MSQGASQIEVGKFTIPIVDHFIGTVLNWALLGALAVQVCLYLLAFPKDRLTNKLIVGFIFIADILETLGDTRDTIGIFGAGRGDFNVLDQVHWARLSVPILGSTVACVGQLFFAWRISVIGNTWYMPSLIVVWAGGIWTGVVINRAKLFSKLEEQHLKAPLAWLSATAAADILIVAATLYYITKARNREFQFRSTNIVLSRIIRVTVETGVLCALFATADLAVFIQFNRNNYHLAICTWLSKVYSNSIMVVGDFLSVGPSTSSETQILNSRAYIGHAVPPGVSQNGISNIVFQSLGPASVVQKSLVVGAGSTVLSAEVYSDSVNGPQSPGKERGQIDP